uniref:Uncharacterized protein n=1 Tax=Romanomermis culicivorax TaxID=13658 RepID=A0A915JPP2_ROMCU
MTGIGCGSFVRAGLLRPWAGQLAWLCRQHPWQEHISRCAPDGQLQMFCTCADGCIGGLRFHEAGDCCLAISFTMLAGLDLN